ncbi:DUF2070 family protein [Candidatus Bathyarchaeota archaeon]|nr:DUF2070 family protein [Candidatus Bathyarchaeota archaeon]
MSEAENYLNVKGTKPYYDLLRRFRFPSHKRIVGEVLAVSLLGGASSFLAYSFDPASLFKGVFYGFSGVFLPLIGAGLAASKIIGRDPILNLRRSLALALFSSILWAVTGFLGGVLGRLHSSFRFPSYPLYAAALLITPIRTLAVTSISSQSPWRKFAASFIEPGSYLSAAHVVAGAPIREVLQVLLAAAALAIAYASSIGIYMESKGRRELSISPSMLFRGFLLEWLEGDNRIVERHLEELSLEDTVKVTVIKFRDKAHADLRAAVAVANFHPGPLLNIGSSILPCRIQEAVKERFNAPIMVPHGISGHERNLVSQAQNEKVISKVVELLEEEGSWGGVTEPVEAAKANASSRCQVFHGCALVTLTLAPGDSEDIPPELEEEILAYSERFFRHAALVDAHNSISRVAVLNGGDVENLRGAAEEAIRRASGMRENPFKLGVAEVDLKDYGLRHGVGPGTGYILLIGIRDKIYSYLILDGNNMASGLREKIHKALTLEGITPVETMTTDTHAVNGIVTSELGYHPIGGAIPHEDLIRRILDAAARAKASMAEAEASYSVGEVRVKTLGLALFSKLASFMHSTGRFIAASMIPLIASSITLLSLMVGWIP